ncbi:hypothetical protein PRN20_00360 [Devosia sp. ZB163]|uniref:hypothetical protein n=1 Tax=Devosia sp. ZB163 TaxID=3025938 RepID=UPI00236082DC|nr:hypothetical protein [Devosia sp. ZB163]MDC9822169.1 hypothetical protein [Devosia sp. ZB163]
MSDLLSADTASVRTVAPHEDRMLMTTALCAPAAALGLRGAYQFVVGQGGLATFSGGIGWRRGFGEAPTAQLGFYGGSPFVAEATPAAADSLLVDAGDKREKPPKGLSTTPGKVRNRPEWWS